MADGAESLRRRVAQEHIDRVGRRLTEQQGEAFVPALIVLLIDQLSVSDVEQAIDAAAKIVIRRHPKPMGVTTDV